MTFSGETLTTRAGVDPLLSRETLADAALSYLGENSLNDDRVSRVEMDVSAMPPVRIHVGDAEVLLDDALRFAQHAEKVGLDHEVHVWEGMTHIFPSSFAILQAAAEALEDIGAFLAERFVPRTKRVLVLGATGGTGTAIVRTLKARGYIPVALVRSPEKAHHLDAEIVQGDARDPASIDRALANVDAVISALGTPVSPFREVSLLSTATSALVKAMERRGIRRIIAITGIGAGSSRQHGGLLFDKIIMPLLLKNVHADKDRQEAIIGGRKLDWIVVRPAILNDKSRRGDVRTLLDLTHFHGGTIARSDVAECVVGQIESDTFIGKTPLISW